MVHRVYIARMVQVQVAALHHTVPQHHHRWDQLMSTKLWVLGVLPEYTGCGPKSIPPNNIPTHRNIV